MLQQLLADALRTNDTRLVAAALGPYATRHFDTESWRQGVLKCLFVGVPLLGLVGYGGLNLAMLPVIAAVAVAAVLATQQPASKPRTAPPTRHPVA